MFVPLQCTQLVILIYIYHFPRREAVCEDCFPVFSLCA